MKRSLTYYLTLLVIKIKGIKRDFSKSPIDYEKIRKEDVHEPKGRFFRTSRIVRFTILQTLVTEIASKKDSKRLLIFIHGGAFISGPSKHHWDSIQEISKKVNVSIWMCDYPKAPEHTIAEISENMDAVYNLAIKKYDCGEITLIGDSVGGTLITALTQRLIYKKENLPSKIILISPVMDATLSNQEIIEKDKKDPMLSRKGVLSAKRMCAVNNNLDDVRMSPIHGNFYNFPKTILFLAEHDITFPDQQLLIKKLETASIDVKVIIGEEMPHIWPFLPIMKEGKLALQKIIEILNQ